MTPLLNASLYAQLMWAGMAATYNLASLIAISRSGVGFAGDMPTTAKAMAAVVVFAAVTGVGLSGRLKLYRWLVPFVTLALFLGGVVKHLVGDEQAYASHATWTAAVIINVFGVGAYAIGVASVFRPSYKEQN